MTKIFKLGEPTGSGSYRCCLCGAGRTFRTSPFGYSFLCNNRYGAGRDNGWVHSVHMRLALVVAVLTLLAASCSSDGETGTANTSAPVANSTVEATAPSAALGDLIAEVDLLVTMFPGSGPGPQAERLAAEMANDALPGSADHLASVATADGLVNIVAYQDRMPNAGGGDRMFCVAELGPSGGGAGCGSEPISQPEAGSATITDGPGAGRNSISAYGGDDAPFAIVVTDKNATIGVITVRGWTYADWPSRWGLPDTITFYDADGSPGFHMSYDLR